jgi:hypothetical protein
VARAPDIVYVIGIGEVGGRLAAALDRAGVRVAPVTRDTGWEEAAGDGGGLRLICVREESLEEVLARLERVPPDRLVLVQNGWIRPLLQDRDQATRGLIWFTSKGEFFRQLRPSPFSGPAAAQLAAALDAGGIRSRHVSAAEFGALEADKMGFNCVVGLPLAVHRVSLAEYLEGRADEARALFEESAGVAAAALGQTPSPRWWPDFVRTVEPLGWVRSNAAKALEFRNGAIAELARRLGRATPVTDRLLRAAGAG